MPGHRWVPQNFWGWVWEGSPHPTSSAEALRSRGLKDRISLYNSIYQLVDVTSKAALEPQAYLVLPQQFKIAWARVGPGLATPLLAWPSQVSQGDTACVICKLHSVLKRDFKLNLLTFTLSLSSNDLYSHWILAESTVKCDGVLRWTKPSCQNRVDLPICPVESVFVYCNCKWM